MITNEWMTPAAEEAAARYDLLVRAWQMMFTQAGVNSDVGSARSLYRVQFDAHLLGQSHLKREREEIRATLEEIAVAAQGVALLSVGIDAPPELSDAVSEAVVASFEHLSLELIVQVERDVAFLTRSLRQHALQVAIAARSQRIPIAAASLQARIGSAVILSVADRAGTKWPSRKFVRTLIRHALLLLYNDVVLITLAEHGIETAEVAHLSAKADVHGMIIAMSPNAEFPTYAEIRDEVFHPNADAIVVPAGSL